MNEQEKIKQAQELGTKHREAVKQGLKKLGFWGQVGGQYVKSLVKGS